MYNVRMDIRFEWDKRKAASNAKKHGVTFDEARTVFFDEFAIQYFDPDHSEEEDKFILLGLSHTLSTIVVCHCFRKEETTVRIISARKADSYESKVYWDNRA